MNGGLLWLHITYGPQVYIWAKKAPLPKDAPAAEKDGDMPAPETAESELEEDPMSEGEQI